MIRALKGIRHFHSNTMKHAVSELSIPVPWGQIRGKVWGPDHGHPVLCLHGYADNCGTFNNLIPLLPEGAPKELQFEPFSGVQYLTKCRYVAVDLAGHGLSSHRPAGVFYTFPSYVMDVRRVVDALQLKKFSIIGHSMGGNVAGTFCALYPEMVDAVIFMDSYGYYPANSKEIPTVMRQGFDEMIEYEKKMKDRRVYTYEKAVERLVAANPSLSEKSVHVLLERGLVQVDGGVMFSRDFSINLKNIARITLEQSLELHSMIQASVLVILADSGFGNVEDPDLKEYTETLLQAYRDRNHAVVRVPGDHHIHLNNPEVVAPLVYDFLQAKVLSATQLDAQTSKL